MQVYLIFYYIEVEKKNGKLAVQSVNIGATEYKKIFDSCLASATFAHEILQNVELIMKLGQKATEQEASHVLDLATELKNTTSELLDYIDFVVSLRSKT